MSISNLQTLQAALDAFKSAPAADRRAAASLATRFAKEVELSEYSAEEQYRALAVAASRRTPQDLQLLEDLKEYSIHEQVRNAAKEERNPATSLFGGTGRRRMPSEAVSDI